MIVQALLVGLVVLLCFLGEFYLGYTMTRRPLVVSALVGLVLGDLKTGIMIGATLELVFMGVVTIGAATPPDTLTGSALGTAFAILLGQGTELAFTLAIPISFLAQFLIVANFIARANLNGRVEKHIESGNIKAIERLHLGASLVLGLILAAVTTLAIALGHDVMKSFIDMIPQVLIDGLNVAGGLLPAVGFALLLKLMWSKQMAMYYFLGFILVSYFNLPILAVAIAGVILAGIFYQEGNFRLLNMKAATTCNDDEEDLFND